MNIAPSKNGKFTLLFILGVMLILSVYPFRTDAQDEPDDAVNDDTNHDMLAYISQDNHLMLYNPETRTETLIFENVGSFLLSRQGYLAFTKADETDTNLYFSDLSTPSIAPIIISQNTDFINSPLQWSPDGKYLAFASYRDWSYESLYVWDGESVTNVMPDEPLAEAQYFYPDWSLDGRLAFTIVYGLSNRDIPTEIYLWDGNKTVNLSQNLDNEDNGATWSNNGQLMFGSYRDNDVYVWDGFYIWDGVSFKDGLPDKASFTRLAPDLDPQTASWMDNGFIQFTVYTKYGEPNLYRKTIFIWDVEHETMIEQYSVTSENWWTRLTEDGRVIISTHLASGMSLFLDVENLEGEILFSAEVGGFSLNSDGYLAYCEWNRNDGWTLSIWDGEETWDMAKVSYRDVQWQMPNERHTPFSCR